MPAGDHGALVGGADWPRWNPASGRVFRATGSKQARPEAALHHAGQKKPATCVAGWKRDGEAKLRPAEVGTVRRADLDELAGLDEERHGDDQPVSMVAGFWTLLAVSPLMPSELSATLRVTEEGMSIVTGASLMKSTSALPLATR